MLAAAWPEPHAYRELHDWVAGLETFGLAGFGWGVAWLDDDDKSVHVDRGLGRYVEEAPAHRGLQAVRSSRFLVHLRRPTKLSTVQLADTQPFVHEISYAFCHNGFFDRAETLRRPYAERLVGGADSEVGWVFFQDRLADGTDPVEALREVDQTFGGKVNLGYLGADATLALYSRNLGNAMWRFVGAGADLAATSIHSDDDSVFRLVFPGTSEPRLIPAGTSVALGDG